MPAPAEPIEVRVPEARPTHPPEVSSPITPAEPEPTIDTDDEPVTDDALYEDPADDAGSGSAPTPESDPAPELLARAAEVLPSPARPKSKRELIDELRRNYDEVLGLVRKMDGHLDAERERGERMLQLAESITPVLATLPELQRSQARLTHAMERLAETTERAADRSEAQRAELAAEQAVAIETVRHAVERNRDAGERVADSMADVQAAAEKIAVGNERLGSLVIETQETGAQRERVLTEAVESSQRWVVTAVSICGAVVALAVIAVMILVFGG
ncbi:MAG: hypothetical protein AAF138_09985 [Planctomycetota bacterium]